MPEWLHRALRTIINSPPSNDYTYGYTLGLLYCAQHCHFAPQAEHIGQPLAGTTYDEALALLPERLRVGMEIKR